MTYRYEGNGHPPAVILGGRITAMAMAGSLRRAGVRVIALPAGGDPRARWLGWLLDEAPAGAAVLPACDDGAELVARHRGVLEARGLRPAEGDDRAARAVLDPDRAYEIARAASISTPWTHCVRGEEDLGSALDVFAYPCRLEPLDRRAFARRSPTPESVLIAGDRAELDTILRRMLRLGVGMRVAEIVGGPDERVAVYTAYVDERGAPLIQFTHRVLRQHPVRRCTGLYLTGEWLPEVARAGLRFARAAGVRGVIVATFKADPVNGRLRLLRCTPRLDVGTRLLRMSGLDAARLAYERALGGTGPAMGPAVWGRHSWHDPDRPVAPARGRPGHLVVSAHPCPTPQTPGTGLRASTTSGSTRTPAMSPSTSSRRAAAAERSSSSGQEQAA